jgi:glycyl-tRNA synthetase beta chain
MFHPTHERQMSDKQDLLIEIGTEELPPKALSRLSEAFLDGICGGLEKHALAYHIAYPFATPRRLAVLVRGLDSQQAPRTLERRGPALAAAYRADGTPTPAAEGFARSCGVTVAELQRLENDKGAWLVYRATQAGQDSSALIPSIVEEALAALPIPKRMRWGNAEAEFIRPVHWVLLLFGTQVIDAEIMGVRSGTVTYGHRFHHPQALTVDVPGNYARLLEEQGKVLPVFSQRKERVRLLTEEAAEVNGGIAVIDEALLDEVTALVEWPVAIVGSFAPDFLNVPAEALIAAMKGHQKYFHMVNNNGVLLPNFITLSNIESSNPEAVRRGNERVIRPRLTDARFFWDQDRRHSLDSRVDSLKSVIFEKTLGSLYDKSLRVAHLCGHICTLLGADELQGIRVGRLSKCDLLTQMVNEFPELQGIMGEYYAHHDGERAEVALALREYYHPRFGGDSVPESTLGRAAALAERLDTLVGIFGIGQAPTGDKDPYGLRRAAIGVLRILIESELDLDLHALLHHAANAYPCDVLKHHSAEEVFDFMQERLRYYFLDQGAQAACIDAVLTCRPQRPLDAEQRIAGVQDFAQLPAAESLAAANKRVHNILKKTTTPLPPATDPTYFKQAEERALFEAINAATLAAQPLIAAREYSAALEVLAGLRDSVDSFFDNVLVMDEDMTVRDNRLALLQSMRYLFLHIADISRLQA